MKRCVLWLLYSLFVVSMFAQQTPVEWLRYTNRDNYLHEIRTDHNGKGGSESLFCENLRQAAIVGLAQQIEVQIDSKSATNKVAHDGRSQTAYQSTSTLSTNLDLQLVQTDISYNRSTGDGAAIAWIDKQAARSHYLNEVRQIFGRVEGCVKMAEEHSATGYDKRAISEFEKAQKLLEDVDRHISRLSLFGLEGGIIDRLLSRCSNLRFTVEQGMKTSQHNRSIYFVCNADMFGTSQRGFGNKIKGGLSSDGCNFVSSAEGAEWSVEIEAAAREHQMRNMGGMSLYTAYVDASIIITNCKTNQVVCSDEISAKGTHTVGYNDAARSAYNDLHDKVLQTIKSYIN